MHDLAALKQNADLWEMVTLASLAVLAIGDIAAFFIEFKKHGLTRQGGFEAIALVALVVMFVAEVKTSAVRKALEAMLAPRHVSDADRLRIVEGLKKQGQPCGVGIEVPLGDGEAAVFAGELKQTFLSAGCLVTGVDSATSFTIEPFGLIFAYIPSDQQAAGRGCEFMRVLFPPPSFSLRCEPRTDVRGITLMVGHRPME